MVEAWALGDTQGPFSGNAALIRNAVVLKIALDKLKEGSVRVEEEGDTHPALRVQRVEHRVIRSSVPDHFRSQEARVEVDGTRDIRNVDQNASDSHGLTRAPFVV